MKLTDKIILAPLFLLAAACVFNSPTPKLVPMEPKEPTTYEWPAAALNAIQADGTTVASITEMQEDWQYDDPCGILATALKRCEGTITYRIVLQDGQAKKFYVYAFAHPWGEFGLHVGEKAVYLWHRMPVFKYAKCKTQQAVSSAYCDYDLLDTFQSDFDVLPVADSARVDSIFYSRHKR